MTKLFGFTVDDAVLTELERLLDFRRTHVVDRRIKSLEILEQFL